MQIAPALEDASNHDESSARGRAKPEAQAASRLQDSLEIPSSFFRNGSLSLNERKISADSGAKDSAKQGSSEAADKDASTANKSQGVPTEAVQEAGQEAAKCEVSPKEAASTPVEHNCTPSISKAARLEVEKAPEGREVCSKTMQGTPSALSGDQKIAKGVADDGAVEAGGGGGSTELLVLEQAGAAESAPAKADDPAPAKADDPAPAKANESAGLEVAEVAALEVAESSRGGAHESARAVESADAPTAQKDNTGLTEKPRASPDGISKFSHATNAQSTPAVSVQRLLAVQPAQIEFRQPLSPPAAEKKELSAVLTGTQKDFSRKSKKRKASSQREDSKTAAKVQSQGPEAHLHAHNDQLLPQQNSTDRRSVMDVLVDAQLLATAAFPKKV